MFLENVLSQIFIVTKIMAKTIKMEHWQHPLANFNNYA